MKDDYYFAVPPFTTNGMFVFDSNGDRVIICDEDDHESCGLMFSERKVDKDKFFMCPKCFRLGQRMVEAEPRHLPDSAAPVQQ